MGCYSPPPLGVRDTPGSGCSNPPPRTPLSLGTRNTPPARDAPASRTPPSPSQRVGHHPPRGARPRTGAPSARLPSRLHRSPGKKHRRVRASQGLRRRGPPPHLPRLGWGNEKRPAGLQRRGPTGRAPLTAPGRGCRHFGRGARGTYHLRRRRHQP